MLEIKWRPAMRIRRIGPAFLGVILVLLCGGKMAEITRDFELWKKMIIWFAFLYLALASSLAFVKLVYLVVIGTINNYFNRRFVFQSIVVVILAFGSLFISVFSGDLAMAGCMVLISGIAYADNGQAFIVQGESLLFYDGGLEIIKVVNVKKGNGMLFVKLENGKEEAVSLKVCSEEQLSHFEKYE